MNIDELGRIAEMMQEYDLSEFSLKSEDMKVTMRRGSQMVSAPVAMHAPAPMPSELVPAAPAAAPGDDVDADAVCGETINSPIVGTFYTAPAPDAPSFVKVGDRVEPDTVVCIVEAMKVMNEIKAEKSGVIKRVLAENAMPVEFGQPIFEIEVD